MDDELSFFAESTVPETGCEGCSREVSKSSTGSMSESMRRSILRSAKERVGLCVRDIEEKKKKKKRGVATFSIIHLHLLRLHLLRLRPRLVQGRGGTRKILLERGNGELGDAGLLRLRKGLLVSLMHPLGGVLPVHRRSWPLHPHVLLFQKVLLWVLSLLQGASREECEAEQKKKKKKNNANLRLEVLHIVEKLLVIQTVSETIPEYAKSSLDGIGDCLLLGLRQGGNVVR